MVRYLPRARRALSPPFTPCTLPYADLLARLFSRTQPGEPRALWASNRVCEAAVRHRKQEQHLHNLRNVRPMIDNRDPRRPKQGNSKGARLEEERNNQIMHENTILLNKLSRILTREPTPIPEPRLVHGLNEVHRRETRERIDRENQALLRRLQDVRPSIDAEAARQQYALHEHLLNARSATFVANPFLNASMDGRSLESSSRPRSRPTSALYAQQQATEVPVAMPAAAPGEAALAAVAEGTADDAGA